MEKQSSEKIASFEKEKQEQSERISTLEQEKQDHPQEKEHEQKLEQ